MTASRVQMRWRAKLAIAPAVSAMLTIAPGHIFNGGLNSGTRQPRPPTYLPTRARKAKRRDRGFNFREVAAVLRPDLLQKLPDRSGDEDLPSGLNESTAPAGLEDDEGAGDV